MTRLASLAIRVHHMDAMRAFYEDALGASFKEVNLGGMICLFGDAGGLEVKLVPLRDDADFEEFPLHQPGFVVDDVDRVIAAATRHGGRQEGDLHETDQGRHAAVRDPDGNTIELYERRD